MDALTLRRTFRHTYAPRPALPRWLAALLRWL